MTVTTTIDDKNTKATIVITMNYPTYKAIEESLLEKELFLEDEVKDAMDKIFTSRVPKKLREFIEMLYPKEQSD